MSDPLPSALEGAGLLYSSAALRAIEAAWAKAHPKISLMQHAGAAVAVHALALIVERKANKQVLVLAGPGNNGGDAWVAAHALQLKKITVLVWALGEHESAELAATHDSVDTAAKKARTAYLKSGGKMTRQCPSGKAFAGFGLIIDGIFGIGLKRAPRGEFAEAIDAANQYRERNGTPILAIDVPSGLSADSGLALGPAIQADATLTFLGLKPGLYTGEGVACCGDIRLDTLGLSLPPAHGAILTAERAAALIPRRRRNSHKGSYGNVGIIGGAAGMVGAAVLAARAALHMGPGKVYLGLVANAAKAAMSFDALNPEIMLRAAQSLTNVLAEHQGMTAMAIGMGLGEDKPAAQLLKAALKLKIPMVIDADALNLIAANPDMGARLREGRNRHGGERSGEPGRKHRAHAATQTILTPHPGEAARLLNTTAAKVQQTRIACAFELAKRFNSIVVLKGAGTIIATPDGHYLINTSGNPGMASGGMGDALSGMIAAFLAQGLPAFEAAQLGVYLHGAAADACLMHGMAPLGLTASEVIFEARTLLNSGLEDQHADHHPSEHGRD